MTHEDIVYDRRVRLIEYAARHGNVAAATSTGGMTLKLPGRIGESIVFRVGACHYLACRYHSQLAAVLIAGPFRIESFVLAGVADGLSALLRIVFFTGALVTSVVDERARARRIATANAAPPARSASTD